MSSYIPGGVILVTLPTIVLGAILLLAGIGFLLIAAIAQFVTEFTNVNNVALPGSVLVIIVNGTNVPIANPIFTFLGPVGLVIACYILLGIGFVSFLASYGL